MRRICARTYLQQSDRAHAPLPGRVPTWTWLQDKDGNELRLSDADMKLLEAYWSAMWDDSDLFLLVQMLVCDRRVVFFYVASSHNPALYFLSPSTRHLPHARIPLVSDTSGVLCSSAV